MLRLIQIHGQFLFDDFALFVNFARIKARIEEHIHDDREKLFKMFGARLGVKAGVLLTGEGVEISANARSEEHTSELQSQSNLVCRLLLENTNIRTSNLST